MKRIPKFQILDRYLIRSFIPSYISGILFFTFITLIFYMKEVIKTAVEKGVPSEIVLKLFLYSMGWTMGLTVPMATLLAVIVTISSLNADSEIIAMRAGGITYTRILRPFLISGILIASFLIWFNHQVIPYCLTQMEVLKVQIVNHDLIAIIEPGQFTRLDHSANEERQIYIEKMERGNIKEGKPDRLKNIQIRTLKRNGSYFSLSQLVIAREGIKIKKKLPNGGWTKALRLFDGYIFTENPNENQFQRIDFTGGQMDLNIISSDTVIEQKLPDSKQSYNYAKLVNKINQSAHPKTDEEKKSLRELKLEYQKRLALPVAVVVFILLGFPLGIVNSRSGKGMGMGISIIFIFLYYLLYLAADSLSVSTTTLSPFMAAWLANFVTLSIAFFFYYTRTNDANYNLLEFIVMPFKKN